MYTFHLDDHRDDLRTNCIPVLLTELDRLFPLIDKNRLITFCMSQYLTNKSKLHVNNREY